MYDKSNLEKNRSRSLLSMYMDSPVKDNAYLIPAPIQSNTMTANTEVGLSDSNQNTQSKKYLVNTRKIKQLIQRTLPDKYETVIGGKNNLTLRDRK